jgi:alpha-D-ribose 1-methylphosphonate 5-triphosphate synthase subunit PhnG
MSHATRRKPILSDEKVRQLTTVAINTSLFLLLVLKYMSRSDLLESLRTKTTSRRDISGFHGGEGTEFYLVGFVTVSRASGYRHIEGMCLQKTRKQTVPPKLG